MLAAVSLVHACPAWFQKGAILFDFREGVLVIAVGSCSLDDRDGGFDCCFLEKTQA
jgi:hypothetical protein